MNTDLILILHAYHPLNTIHILVYITGICNYSCNYCSFAQYNNTQVLNLDLLYRFLIALYEYKNAPIYIELIGGEPSLHPLLLVFAKKIYKYFPKIKIKVYSNFSLDVNLYIELLKYNFEFIFTWHSIQNDKINKNFILNCFYVKNIYNFNLNNIDIHVMYEFNNIKNSILVFNKLKSNFNNTELCLLDYNFNTNLIYFLKNCKYSKQDLSIYNTLKQQQNLKYKKKYLAIYNYDIQETISVQEMYLNLLFYNFKHWYCDAGYNYFFISTTGNIYLCQEFYTLNKYPIGNIKNNLDFKFKHLMCFFDKCPCVWEAKKKKIFR